MKRFAVVAVLSTLIFSSPAFADNSSVTVSVTSVACNDGTDNDGDSLIDFSADPGCSSLLDDDETNAPAACGDSADNDGDGGIDFPADLGCDSATDDSENSEGSGSGSGGGIIGRVFETSITFRGTTFPQSSVRVLRDGTRVTEVVSSNEGTFVAALANVFPGVSTFQFVAYKSTGERIGVQAITVFITPFTHTDVGGINIFPENEDEEVFEGRCPRGDLNDDCLIDLFDFSILAFWWEREIKEPFRTVEQVKLNGDEKVDIFDFSILAYYWTG